MTRLNRRRRTRGEGGTIVTANEKNEGGRVEKTEGKEKGEKKSVKRRGTRRRKTLSDGGPVKKEARVSYEIDPKGYLWRSEVKGIRPPLAKGEAEKAKKRSKGKKKARRQETSAETSLCKERKLQQHNFAVERQEETGGGEKVATKAGFVERNRGLGGPRTLHHAAWKRGESS